MNILYLCAKEYWDRKVPRTRFDCIEAMSRLTEDLRCTGLGFSRWHEQSTILDNLSVIYPGWTPDAIIVYKPEQYTGWGWDGMPLTVTTFNDAWETDSRIRDIQLPKCKLVIMHHQNEVKEWRDRCPDVDFVNIPYGINEEVFTPNTANRPIDILLTGCTAHKIYPLRYRFKRMIEGGAFRPFHAVIRNHCGYRIDDPSLQAIEYADQLRIAKICLADTSKYGYAAEKYHEIPACGSVICGNMPQERENEFREFILEVEPKWSDERILNDITELLHDHQRWTEMSQRGMAYVRNHHTRWNYARHFLGELERRVAPAKTNGI